MEGSFCFAFATALATAGDVVAFTCHEAFDEVGVRSGHLFELFL